MSTYVLVHGAFHGAWMWDKVVPLLQAKGHRVVTLDLPGHGEDRTLPAAVTLQAYVERVCEAIDKESDQVILVGHSMGGMVISQVAENRPEKVKSLVYLAAMLPHNGESLFQLNQGDKYALPLPVSISEDQTYLLLDVSRIKDNFYGECSDEDVAFAQAKLCRQPLAPFITPVQLSEERYGSIPRKYISTSKDRALSIEFQRELQERTHCQEVVTIDSDHSPFFSHPDELVAALT